MGLDNPIHLAILLMVLLLVFGAKRLPEMGRSLGDGMRGFRDSLSGTPHAEISTVANSAATSVAAEALPSEPTPVA
jgi:sec-independent protein translocase protein TatA